jgi:serine protease
MKLHIGYQILILIAICSLIMLIVPASALQDANSDDILEKGTDAKKTEKYVPGEILVKFKPGISDKEIGNINAKHETSVLYTSPYAGFKTLKVPKTKTVEEMAEIYSKNPNVEYAVPNYLMYATTAPNDPYYKYQWNFNSPYGINVEPAWSLDSTGSGVIVAVIDTGIKKGPDLAYTNFVPGYDFVNADTDPTDDNGHGTHVTGTIAQSTNNDEGVAGVAYGCTIMPVKVLDASGSGTLGQLVDGIYYASGKNNDNKADVISMSLGFPPYVTAKMLAPLFPALDYAYSQGIVILAAAGNDGVSKIGYPAAYDKCIAVGATRYDGTRAYYSNYGSALDIMAPGGDMRIDQNIDGYGDGIIQNTFDPKTGIFNYYFYQGTSMATPHVSGVAALLIEDGVTGPDNVRMAMQSTAKDMGTPGWDSGYGWGIVDAYKALTYQTTPEPSGQISIDTVEVRCTSRTVKKNTLVTAHATVTIVDTTGDTVQEATVSGTWSGATTDSDTGDTNDDGQVTLSSNEVKVTSSATFTFTVNAVSYTIPWDGNTESGTITYTK